MQIYISRDGEQNGPYGIEDVNAYLEDGTILPTDLACQDGMTEWVPITQIPGVVMAGDSSAHFKKTGCFRIWLIGSAVYAVFMIIAHIFGMNIYYDSKEDLTPDPDYDSALNIKMMGFAMLLWVAPVLLLLVIGWGFHKVRKKKSSA